MYRDDEDITIPTQDATVYVHTTQFPIFRIANLYDNKHQMFLTTPNLKQTKLLINAE